MTKFYTLPPALLNKWSRNLSPATGCKTSAPPIPPGKIHQIRIENFRLNDKREATFRVEWSEPLKPNGNITEYQLRINVSNTRTLRTQDIDVSDN